jgi:hypothetical protein
MGRVGGEASGWKQARTQARWRPVRRTLAMAPGRAVRLSFGLTSLAQWPSLG